MWIIVVDECKQDVGDRRGQRDTRKNDAIGQTGAPPIQRTSSIRSAVINSFGLQATVHLCNPLSSVHYVLHPACTPEPIYPHPGSRLLHQHRHTAQTVQYKVSRSKLHPQSNKSMGNRVVKKGLLLSVPRTKLPAF
jgi:hypothetical protein